MSHVWIRSVSNVGRGLGFVRSVGRGLGEMGEVV